MTDRSGRPPRWDLLCQVVDNYGDAGVLWRLARRLAADGRRSVRLWIDDVDTLASLAPGAAHGRVIDGVRILRWRPDPDDGARCADVLVTGFDARPPAAWRRRMKPGAPLWITVDHLSAEAWVEDFHRSPSPKPDGLVEHYFYPGFSAGTGGLLLEPGILADRDAARALREAAPAPAHASCLLFCYRPSPVLALARALRTASLQQPGSAPSSWTVHVPRASETGVKTSSLLSATRLPPGRGRNSVTFAAVPFVAQPDFDAALRAHDLNLVRGEDSLVRAIWAARPFLWQAWRQDAETRGAKVEAFLAHQAGWLHPADQAALASLTRWWNGLPRHATDDPIAAAFARLFTHRRRIEAGLCAWGDALSRRELAAELIRFAGERAGRPL